MLNSLSIFEAKPNSTDAYQKKKKKQFTQKTFGPKFSTTFLK